MSRLRVVHTTSIEYDAPVRASYNEVRMTPATLPGQHVLEARVEVSPRAAASRYTDYWGTHVVAFDTQVPHTRLDVVATNLVEVEVPPGRPGDTTAHVGWDDLADRALQDELVEWLAPRTATRPGPDLLAQSREVAGDLPPHEAALAVCSWLGGHLQYVPGVTGVHTSAEEAWAEGRGVCQDFVHVGLGALRALGVPARYVSGYLHPDPSAPLGQAVVGQSHAWLEWWAGAWTPFDPTNGRPAGLDHVVVATGRDYGDVAPLRGIVSGGGGSRLDVSVEITRLR
ncbi:transglutaminase family protein [Aquipuribacter nitratireducens]|uniref:Transglutaminase N-terminal domain-containing protein n=1 Tax=Aquipuribacter nitratireducens TaxID=650104 RepID=A0ABW0GJS0_9MICO